MLANAQSRLNLALFATLLTFSVMILGAYTRLTDAGLGCPDWPDCYGHWWVPENIKASTEMIHRYVAGTLGIVIAILFISHPTILSFSLALTVIFQALLGMWTVTLKLFPLVVMAHLLGGLTTLSLLFWLILQSIPHLRQKYKIKNQKYLHKIAMIGLISLMIQIMLGGWTSANYAALVCLDFPFCEPQAYLFDFKNAFNITTAGVTGSIGEPLSQAARITVHMTHRIGALITALILGYLGFACLLQAQTKALTILGVILLALLMIQILLGISNVLLLLPLPIAVAHHAVAALLLIVMVTFTYVL